MRYFLNSSTSIGHRTRGSTMQYQTTQHQVQAVTWTGERFTETPHWLPDQVSIVAFATNPLHKLHCEPPYAWYGEVGGPIRLEPGDLLVCEAGCELRVWKGERFRDIFASV